MDSLEIGLFGDLFLWVQELQPRASLLLGAWLSASQGFGAVQPVGETVKSMPRHFYLTLES